VTSSAFAGDKSLDERNLASFLSLPAVGLIRVYKKVFAPIRTANCPMVPSDSAFALEAIEKRGPFWGPLMASDRILRCGNDVGQYGRVVFGRKMFYFDPVEARWPPK